MPTLASAGKAWRQKGLSWQLLCAAVPLNPTNTCTLQGEERQADVPTAPRAGCKHEAESLHP